MERGAPWRLGQGEGTWPFTMIWSHPARSYAWAVRTGRYKLVLGTKEETRGAHKSDCGYGASHGEKRFDGGVRWVLKGARGTSAGGVERNDDAEFDEIRFDGSAKE